MGFLFWRMGMERILLQLQGKRAVTLTSNHNG